MPQFECLESRLFLSGSAPEDTYENDDSAAVVASYPEGEVNSPNLGPLTQTLRLQGLTMEDGVDWFRFVTLSIGNAADNVRIDFSNDQGDLDLLLYREDATTVVGLSGSTNDYEKVSLANQPAGVYYVKVNGWRSGTNTNYSLTINIESPETLIDVWYGDQQQFGANGNPQRWINILGNVTDRDGVVSLSFTLNGGASQPLSIGSDGRRLEQSGDFNVEIDRSSLLAGDNVVVITAVDDLGNVTSRTVNVQYTPSPVLGPIVDVHWSEVASVKDAAQVVDGQWGIQSGMVQPLVIGYDRVLAFGDMSWQDYEITVPLTIHRPGAIGIVTRWQGHWAWNGDQPTWGWAPSGATAWYYWPGDVGMLKIEGNDGDLVKTTSLQAAAGVSYTVRYLCQTQADGRTLYNLKMWATSDPEPEEWMLTTYGDRGNLPNGSVLLVAHEASVSFGDVTIRPALRGDFNWDRRADLADLDLLSQNLGGSIGYDLTCDGLADQHDLGEMVVNVLQTRIGDTNLDKLVNFTDFQTLVYNWQLPAPWSGGNFNGDGRVDFQDFQVMLNNWLAMPPADTTPPSDEVATEITAKAVPAAQPVAVGAQVALGRSNTSASSVRQAKGRRVKAPILATVLPAIDAPVTHQDTLVRSQAPRQSPLSVGHALADHADLVSPLGSVLPRLIRA